jgi:ubiquinone/menaquinone biosynthesis C-methylase UbiE
MRRVQNNTKTTRTTFVEIVANLFSLIYVYKFNARYDLRDLLLCPRNLDAWKRYSSAAKEIRGTDDRNGLVLDVGSGGEGIFLFLKRLREKEIISLDLKKESFVRSKVRDGYFFPIVGSACNLPFREKVFEAIACIDMLEHIPKEQRQDCISELRRVGRKVIIHTPVNSKSREYRGSEYDLAYFNYCMSKGLRADRNTIEHIELGLPTIHELEAIFPRGRFTGQMNCVIWLKNRIWSRCILSNFVSRWIYFLSWKELDDKPPFWGVMIISDEG